CSLPSRTHSPPLFIASHTPPHSPLSPYTTLFRSNVARQAPASWKSARLRELLSRQRFVGSWGDAFTLSRAVACRREKFSKPGARSEEHTSELQSRLDIVCRLHLEQKKRDIAHQQP